MKTPSPAALIDRARTLVVKMHGVERWAYALDAALPKETVESAIAGAGYRTVETDEVAQVRRYEAPTDRADADGLVVLRRPDLGVVLLQAYGATTPDRLGPLLEKTGFVPQSRLLREAYEVGSDASRHALTALAHMVVAWDEDWADLFLLHLASPDPIARHDAALATVIAALSAREREPAQTLLAEAERREQLPKLRETLGEALTAVRAIAPRGAPGASPP